MGGGALGGSAALALADRGHDVTLRERATLGAGATHKAAGISSTFTWDARERALIEQTRGMVGELIALAMCEGDMAARDTWRPTDSLLVGRRAEALDAVQAIVEAGGEEVERLSVREAERAYPMLRFDPGQEALVAQEDGVLDAGALMGALRTRLRGEGVRVEEGVAASLPPEGSFDAVVVAGGAWTRGLLAGAGHDLPLAAFRTQLATVEMPGPVPVLHDLDLGFYARPESDASMLVGNGTRLAPHDPADYDEGPDTQFRDHVAEAVVQRFRDGGQARWRTGWAGLCVATPDRHPLCGPVPGGDDLFVLTGDNGFGLMRCLALGERLADAVDGRVADWLDPGRFGGAHLDGFPLREGFGDLTA